MTTASEPQTADLLADEQQWTGKIFSDGWVDAPDTIETIEPATGEVLGTAGAGDAATVAKAAASAAAAQREWAALPVTERVAVVAKAAELFEQHRPELERWLIRESGSIPGKAAQEISASAGQLQMAAALIAHPLGLRAAVAHAGAHEHGPARPDRGGRCDHAVELPLRAGDALGRPGARARQRGRAQGGLEHAGHRRRCDRADLRGGRAARGRAARPPGRARRRPGAGRGPQRADDLVHRVDRDGPQGRRGRGSRPQAHGARDRRQQPADRARRRGHRGGVLRGGVGLVPAPGADLPRGQPPPRARERRRRLHRGAGRAGRAPAGRQPGDRRGRARADHQLQAGRSACSGSSTRRCPRAPRR